MAGIVRVKGPSIAQIFTASIHPIAIAFHLFAIVDPIPAPAIIPTIVPPVISAVTIPVTVTVAIIPPIAIAPAPVLR